MWSQGEEMLWWGLSRPLALPSGPCALRPLLSAEGVRPPFGQVCSAWPGHPAVRPFSPANLGVTWWSPDGSQAPPSVLDMSRG